MPHILEKVKGQIKEMCQLIEPCLLIGTREYVVKMENEKLWPQGNSNHMEAGIAKAGLKIKDMGITWQSHGRFNAEKRKSALDHHYLFFR